MHCLDAKVTLDDNAAFRHPEWDEFAGSDVEDEREARAKERGLNYIGLDGSVGIIANGAGLAMSTLDVVNQCGGSAANFLDIGGGANADVMAAALEVINSDPAVRSIFVNIFGGITRVDEVAKGVLEALDRVDISSPIVLRLDGTNAVAGREILADHLSDRLVAEPTMLDAATPGGRPRRRPVMSIFVDENTKVVVQGISPTSQGLYHGLRNRAYGTQVVAGTNPNRGGEEIEGIPVFATVAEAVAATGANASFISVPPKFAADAIVEAAAAGVPFVVCITEGIPAQDEALAYNRLVRDFPGTRLLGPNCPGIISPGKCNIGITSGDIAMAGGPVGIVSRSGTLTYQALHELSQQGVGQTTCVGIGGDPVPGTSFIDCLAAFEADPDTRAIMMIGEIGGSAEEEAAEFIASSVTKPVVSYVAGVTAPPGRKMGHAGAIVSGLQGHGPGQDGGPVRRRGHRGPQPDRGRGGHGRHRAESRLTAPLPSASALAGRPIHAVIFDLDGLLIDSEPFWRQAEIEVFGSLGLELSESDVRQTMGLRIDDAVRHWWVRSPWEGMTTIEVERAVTARVAELIGHSGAPDARCRRVGVALCPIWPFRWRCARAPTPWSSRPPCGDSGIESDVAVWHSAEWEPLGKPHPGSYLSTASKLGIDPTSCLAVEDSFNGAISAKAARMRVVVVPEPEAARLAAVGVLRRQASVPHRLRRGTSPLARGAGRLTVRRRPPRNFRFGNVRSVPIHEARGAFPGQGRPSDVGPIPEAGRSGHVAPVLLPGKSRTRPGTGALGADSQIGGWYRCRAPIARRWRW